MFSDQAHVTVVDSELVHAVDVHMMGVTLNSRAGDDVFEEEHHRDVQVSVNGEAHYFTVFCITLVRHGVSAVALVRAILGGNDNHSLQFVYANIEDGEVIMQPRTYITGPLSIIDGTNKTLTRNLVMDMHDQMI